MKRAPLIKRIAAAAIDLIVPAVVGVGVSNAIAQTPYRPEPGWFWSEWLLKIWLDHPEQLIAPLVTTAVTLLVWQTVWESVLSRTPGGVLMRLEVVDAWGDPIEWPRALLRLVGGMLSFTTLGLGWFWAWVDPESRSLPDRLSGTWVVAKESSRSASKTGHERP